METTEHFALLFSGCETAHGTFVVGDAGKSGKVGGRATTLKRSPDEQAYAKHLEGRVGLGIVPLRADSTVLFAAIDIDDYSIDPAKLVAWGARTGAKFVVCRTKSGGAHVYVFLSEPAPAKAIREVLGRWCTALGYPGIEIFPKQNKLSEGGTGNWINLPYFDAERTTRYAYGPDLKALTLAEFCELAETQRTTLAEMQAVEVEDPRFVDAPPCIRRLVAEGIPEGGRNNALLHMAVFAKRKWPDHLPQVVQAFNEEFMGPGTPQEVQAVINSVNRGVFYTCETPPMCNVCDKPACKKTPYGVGGGGKGNGAVGKEVMEDEFPLKGVAIIESQPPIWVLDYEVNGRVVSIHMETADLMNQQRFRERCLERLLRLPKAVRGTDWTDYVNDISARAERREAPDDAGAEGQFWYMLEKFCVDRPEARNRDELLAGKPWHDTGRTYFRSSDFFRYLMQQRMYAYKEHQIWALLGALGAERHFFKVKGRGVNCWSIPEFAQQQEPFDVPRAEDAGEF